MRSFGVVVAVVLTTLVNGTVAAQASGLIRFDTGYTISKMRTAYKDGNSYIVASSYEGTVLGMQYDGTILWANTLSGFMNHDLWCEDGRSTWPYTLQYQQSVSRRGRRIV